MVGARLGGWSYVNFCFNFENVLVGSGFGPRSNNVPLFLFLFLFMYLFLLLFPFCFLLYLFCSVCDSLFMYKLCYLFCVFSSIFISKFMSITFSLSLSLSLYLFLSLFLSFVLFSFVVSLSLSPSLSLSFFNSLVGSFSTQMWSNIISPPFQEGWGERATTSIRQIEKDTTKN